MKKFAAVLTTMVLATSLANAKSCLLATNPSQAIIKSLSASGKVLKHEKAWKVEAILEDEIPGGPQNDPTPATLTLKATSQSMEFNTVAVHFPELGQGTYIVECDGGSAKVTESLNGYNMNSRSLQGTIGASTDCSGSDAVIVLKNVNFEDNVCAD